jgi:hypothetical protein
MKRLFALLPIAVVVACGSRPAPPPPKVAGGPPAQPRIVEGGLEARPLLGDLPARASKLGAGPLAIVASGPMGEGERLGAFVEVPRDACLLAYGRASASLEDIDLAAFADEGNPVAVDEGPDPRPTILLCPPHPDRVYVAAHAAAGEGLCVIGAQLVPKDKALELARAVGAHGGTARSAESWPGLEEQIRGHRAAIGGTWEELRRVATPVDSRAVSAVAFTVEEGGCADALVIPDTDVSVIDVEVLDAESRLVARAKDTGTVRSVTVCSPIAINGTLQVRPHVGRGVVAVVVSKAKADSARELHTKPDVAWAAPTTTVEQARNARNAALTKVGYGAPTATQNGQLQLGRRLTIPVDLPKDPSSQAQGCSRIDVVGGAPTALVDAAIWDDAGALLASGDGIDGATLFACGKGKARVDLGVRGRPGPYSLLVRPERWKDPSFAAHPLAAGRMLSRAATGAPSLHDGTVALVKHVTLDTTHQFVHPTSIPAGQCLRVAVGAEGEGTGLDLRLFDVADGEELDRSHGQTSAAVRGCAPATGARNVRIEARASAGKLEAILAGRLVPSK